MLLHDPGLQGHHRHDIGFSDWLSKVMPNILFDVGAVLPDNISRG